MRLVGEHYVSNRRPRVLCLIGFQDYTHTHAHEHIHELDDEFFEKTHI